MRIGLMRSSAAAIAAIVSFTPASLAAEPAPGEAPELTLELIMSDPDWIGALPESPHWADDGESIFFRRKQPGSDQRDLVEIDLDGNELRIVEPADLGSVSRPGGERSLDGRLKVYAWSGDIFLKHLDTGELRQLTRTPQRESSPAFMTGDTRIMFQRGSDIVVRDLLSGLEYAPADILFEDAPDNETNDEPYLVEQQKRLFEHLRERERRRDEARERERAHRAADPTQLDPPFYLGAERELRQATLSPNGDWMLLRTRPNERGPARRDTMPVWVTEDGYVESQPLRPKVGEPRGAPEQLVLLNLRSRDIHELDLSVLPGIADDPLDEVRQENRALRDASEAEDPTADAEGDADSDNPPEESENGADEAESSKSSKPRPVSIFPMRWSRDGSRVVFQAFSHDNKDRWVAAVDLDEPAVRPLFHHRDEAWINGRLVRLGWMPDNRTIWITTERTGYAHLTLIDVETGGLRPLTSGEHVVSSVTPTRDGSHLYFLANMDHPGEYEVHRVSATTGLLERLTDLGGRNSFVLSPDESKLLLMHSTALRPAEVYVQEARPGAEARRLTHSTSETFDRIAWSAPEIVPVPSRHGRPIYSRIYTPEEDSDQPRPAVMFVHGAGYLQNAHAGWSNYFREFMFHTLLTRLGYVVIDMDYRASAGYGRDWRTAIYRRMGTPEVEDMADGVAHLAEHYNVDPSRVGVYGGSYGGFLTLMALFTEPGLFACGAALRPVTDWAHYNHGYTSNILNTPEIDPIAFERSSPIEFAEGLEKPLLMCHGMVDDNVVFQDTVRLAQRLIELEKENWEVAIYPVEPHGFREPSSWLDEYRRILKLMNTHLE